MARPTPLEPYIKRYERVMYKNSTNATSSRAGFEHGKKYAKTTDAIPLDRLIATAERINVPSKYGNKDMFRFCVVLGYLKQKKKYDESDEEQQFALDAMIGFGFDPDDKK